MLLLAHSCGDAYDTAQIAQYWDIVRDGSWTVGTGRTGNCLSVPVVGMVTTVGQNSIVQNLPVSASGAMLTVGFALRLDSVPVPDMPSIFDDVAGLYTKLGAVVVRLQTDSRGRLGLVTGTAWGALGAVTSQTLTLNTWYYVELVAVDGSTSLYVNEELWAACPTTGLPSTLAFAKEQTLINISSGNTPGFSIDDLYVLDDMGARNKSRLGDTGVLLSLPIGAGDSTQWTVHGIVNNWQAAAKNPQDPTVYNSAAASGLKDLYQYGALSLPAGVTITQIFGVSVTPSLMRDSTGLRTIHNVIKTLGAELEGSKDIKPSMGYRYFPEIFETDAGGNAWLQSVVEAMQAGPKVVL